MAVRDRPPMDSSSEAAHLKRVGRRMEGGINSYPEDVYGGACSNLTMMLPTPV